MNVLKATNSGGNSKVQFSGLVLYLSLRSMQNVFQKATACDYAAYIPEGYFSLVGRDEKVAVKIL